MHKYLGITIRDIHEERSHIWTSPRINKQRAGSSDADNSQFIYVSDERV